MKIVIVAMVVIICSILCTYICWCAYTNRTAGNYIGIILRDGKKVADIEIEIDKSFHPHFAFWDERPYVNVYSEHGLRYTVSNVTDQQLKKVKSIAEYATYTVGLDIFDSGPYEYGKDDFALGITDMIVDRCRVGAMNENPIFYKIIWLTNR